jgi:4-amino-4-deoxy-L-arabinose transferase-like glycosyltransferase
LGIGENMKKKLLALIIVLAFVLRFYDLGNYPALNADEAALGYNAYSLLETGKDEHGNPWPLHFQSFNDYKPGLYVYLVVPFVKLLGLTVWSVRLPGAMIGVVSVLLMYFVVKELFKENKLEIRNSKLEIIASFMLAISPWHVHFSRGGWEVNVSTFLILLGFYLFIKGRRNLPILMLSAVAFALSFYTYHSARVIAPLLVAGLLFFFREDFQGRLKDLALVGLVGLVALLPLVKDLTRSEVAARVAGVGLFADAGPVSRVNEQRGEHHDPAGFLAVLLHNKPVNYSLAFGKNWGEHFGGDFLFISGDAIQRNKVPETGQLYMLEILTLLTGVFVVLKSPRSWAIIIFWLIIAPTAAALTFQSPHSLRSHNMIIPLTIISSAGILHIYNSLQSLKVRHMFRTMITAVLVVAIAVCVLRYLHMYYMHMSKEYPYSSQYAVYELVNYLNTKQGDFDKIVVTTAYDQPYILFLFYNKFPPALFQDDHELTDRDIYGFSTVPSFSNYVFKPVNYDTDRLEYKNSLIIGTPDEIPDGTNVVKDIYGSNGYLYFKVVEN